MRLVRFFAFISSIILSTLSVAQVPYMESCLINSCGNSSGACQEGNNEIIFLNTGASSVLVNSANVSISYGNVANPPTNYTDAGLVTNASTTTALNTAAGCAPNLLVEATGTVVPPNSLILVVQNGICAGSLNWPGLCSMGPIYITYSNDANWLAGGNFVNSTGNLRHFRTSITNTLGTTTTIDYNYTLPGAFGTDGAFATWSNTGGAAASYGDNDCVLSPTILPVSLISFGGFASESTNYLEWITDREVNNDFFEIKRSTDGINYERISTIPSTYSKEKAYYSFEDPFLESGYIYYQLYQTDLDGKKQFLDEIVIYRKNENENTLFPNPSSGIISVSLNNSKSNSLIQYYVSNQNGTLVKEEIFGDFTNENLISFDLSDLSKGVYTLHLVFEDKIEQKKFILQ
ncbi:MAG: T9SS type A sorting domain-containing protein [Fluviicola sp.]